MGVDFKISISFSKLIFDLENNSETDSCSSEDSFLSIICLLSSITFGCIFYSYVEKKLKLVKNKKYI